MKDSTCSSALKSQMIHQMRQELADCGPLFIALGEEIRQQIVLTLLDAQCEGMCVNKITQQTHLSRPAVSHHLKILKEAGIIQVRTQGTQNFYYLNGESSIRRLSRMFQRMEEMLARLEALSAESL